MSLLTASGLTKSFGHIDIFTGVTFGIARGARFAIVGPNGIGKTTLLRILVGEDEATRGSITRARGLRIGYLPQEADFQMAGTLWDECVAVFADLIRMQDELHRLEAQMSTDHSDETLARYGELQHTFDLRGGYTYQTRIKQVLTGLGFEERDYALTLDKLSGGQRTRAFLARLLLSDPDLLVLDEPTNHLDIQAVEWLEGYLSQWEGAAIIVSHDRYFLDKVATSILEMSRIGIEEYRGNYSHYLQQREERWTRRREVFEAEKEKLLKEALYVKKYIAGQNVTQAKGRLRRLSRIIQAIEQIGLEAVLNQKWSETASEVEIATSLLSPDEAERRVRAMQMPDIRPPRLHLSLRAEKRSGELVIRTRGIQVGYPGRLLFSSPDIELRRTECAALIGPNGAGKSTFLKTILGQLEPLAGEVILGASLEIGYFAQAHEGLDPNKSVMDEIDALRPQWLPGQIRDYLGKYLFSGEDVFKKVDMLSGGERGRLALAKLALSDTNLLLLDEPTNHLDIPSQEILQQVLEGYNGTILLVTHDRYLIDALGNQIWEITEETSEVSPRLDVFKGTYSQRREERERLAALAEGVRSLPTSAVAKPRRQESSDSTRAERRRLAQMQELENQIAALEAKLAELGFLLENPPDDPAKVAKLGREYNKIQGEMDEKLAEWEAVGASASHLT
ncbi:MAG: ribosomal protection-like ABC-F family protein [Chloroflexota bacterium]